MKKFLKTSAHYLRAGWYWALALLILPNCSFEAGGFGSSNNLWRGSVPRDAAIFCDIEKPLVGRRCSTATDRAMGIRLADAAVALNEGRTAAIGLDDSADALARCSGQPEAVLFEGAFPEGLSVCLNCSEVIPAWYADANAVCQARCYDMFGATGSDGTIIPENPPAPSVVSFCAARAKISTNFPATACFGGACTDDGTLRPDFIDPRRTSEVVTWTNHIGTAPGGSPNDLVRTAATTGNFDAGAVSTQWFTKGDGYVEFSVPASDKAQRLGLTAIPAACPAPCADTDPSGSSLGYSIAVGLDGRVYLFESGAQVPGPDINGSFGTYSVGERFRVMLRDTGTGTATVSYGRVVGSCTPGVPCNVSVFHTSTSTAATYPLRVDTSLREQGATLSNVRVVRIQ